VIPLQYHILAAVVLDLLVGDPRWMPHPVKLMGRLATCLETPTRRVLRNARLAGIVTMLIVVGVSAAAAWGLLNLASVIHPVAGTIVSIFLLYTCLATRDLANHSRAVYRGLAGDDIAEARRAVGMIVGRDTECLDRQGVTRAAVESVAENLLDGVTAPLLLAAAAGPVGAIAYKAINTLDSTFGYKSERYLHFGWASARIDDVVNWLPARLTAPVVAAGAAILGMRPVSALRIAWRDRGKHTSPNSAWPEGAFAGAMGVQLGGPTQYGGVVTNHPTIGDAGVALVPNHIKRSNALMYATSLLFAAMCMGAMTLAQHILGGWRMW
jgi:adenosylcobinamide-phosphate synthase